MFTLSHSISPQDSFEIEKAISYLISNYKKSGNNPKPVILHSIRVATILMELGYCKKIIIGAILHDIIEDTAVTKEQLKSDFGEYIQKLVCAVSYNEKISDPIKQYKDMFERVICFGKDAIVLKSIDIAVNSLYIQLVSDKNKQEQLIKKGTYFLELTKKYSNENAWKLLKERNLTEIKRIS